MSSETVRTPILGRIVAGVVVLALAAVVVVPRMLAQEHIELVAVFDAVGDLVPRAHVRVGDVPVGTIRDIALTDDHRAAVTMRLDPDTPLPREVVANLRLTSLLGERYIDLTPAPGSSGTIAVDGVVVETGFESDLEQLVASGDHLLAAVAADQLGQVVRVGARTFAGRGATTGALIDDLGSYVSQLEEGRDDLARFIDASASLVATLAPDAELTAGALEDLADLTEVLVEEEDRLVTALERLQGASQVGTRILAEERESIDRVLLRVRRIAGELLRVDQALENVLLWLPRHNLHVPGGVVAEFSQVAVDFTVCGLTDVDGDPSNSCDPPNPGRSNDPPPDFHITECALYHVGCTGYPAGIWPYRGEVEAARTTAEERQRKVEHAQRTLADPGMQPRPQGDRDPRLEGAS